MTDKLDTSKLIPLDVTGLEPIDDKSKPLDVSALKPLDVSGLEPVDAPPLQPVAVTQPQAQPQAGPVSNVFAPAAGSSSQAYPAPAGVAPAQPAVPKTIWNQNDGTFHQKLKPGEAVGIVFNGKKMMATYNPATNKFVTEIEDKSKPIGKKVVEKPGIFDEMATPSLWNDGVIPPPAHRIVTEDVFAKMELDPSQIQAYTEGKGALRSIRNTALRTLPSTAATFAAFNAAGIPSAAWAGRVHPYLAPVGLVVGGGLAAMGAGAVTEMGVNAAFPLDETDELNQLLYPTQNAITQHAVALAALRPSARTLYGMATGDAAALAAAGQGAAINTALSGQHRLVSEIASDKPFNLAHVFDPAEMKKDAAAGAFLMHKPTLMGKAFEYPGKVLGAKLSPTPRPEDATQSTKEVRAANEPLDTSGLEPVAPGNVPPRPFPEGKTKFSELTAEEFKAIADWDAQYGNTHDNTGNPLNRDKNTATVNVEIKDKPNAPATPAPSIPPGHVEPMPVEKRIAGTEKERMDAMKAYEEKRAMWSGKYGKTHNVDGSPKKPVAPDGVVPEGYAPPRPKWTKGMDPEASKKWIDADDAWEAQYEKTHWDDGTPKGPAGRAASERNAAEREKIPIPPPMPATPDNSIPPRPRFVQDVDGVSTETIEAYKKREKEWDDKYSATHWSSGMPKAPLPKPTNGNADAPVSTNEFAAPDANAAGLPKDADNATKWKWKNSPAGIEHERKFTEWQQKYGDKYNIDGTPKEAVQDDGTRVLTPDERSARTADHNRKLKEVKDRPIPVTKEDAIKYAEEDSDAWISDKAQKLREQAKEEEDSRKSLELIHQAELIEAAKQRLKNLQEAANDDPELLGPIADAAFDHITKLQQQAREQADRPPATSGTPKSVEMLDAEAAASSEAKPKKQLPEPKGKEAQRVYGEQMATDKLDSLKIDGKNPNVSELSLEDAQMLLDRESGKLMAFIGTTQEGSPGYATYLANVRKLKRHIDKLKQQTEEPIIPEAQESSPEVQLAHLREQRDRLAATQPEPGTTQEAQLKKLEEAVDNLEGKLKEPNSQVGLVRNEGFNESEVAQLKDLGLQSMKKRLADMEAAGRGDSMDAKKLRDVIAARERRLSGANEQPVSERETQDVTVEPKDKAPTVESSVEFTQTDSKSYNAQRDLVAGLEKQLAKLDKQKPNKYTDKQREKIKATLDKERAALEVMWPDSAGPKPKKERVPRKVVYDDASLRRINGRWFTIDVKNGGSKNLSLNQIKESMPHLYDKAIKMDNEAEVKDAAEFKRIDADIRRFAAEAKKIADSDMTDEQKQDALGELDDRVTKADFGNATEANAVFVGIDDKLLSKVENSPRPIDTREAGERNFPVDDPANGWQEGTGEASKLRLNIEVGPQGMSTIMGIATHMGEAKTAFKEGMAADALEMAQQGKGLAETLEGYARRRAKKLIDSFEEETGIKIGKSIKAEEKHSKTGEPVNGVPFPDSGPATEGLVNKPKPNAKPIKPNKGSSEDLQRKIDDLHERADEMEENDPDTAEELRAKASDLQEKLDAMGSDKDEQHATNTNDSVKPKKNAEEANISEEDGDPITISGIEFKHVSEDEMFEKRDKGKTVNMYQLKKTGTSKKGDIVGVEVGNSHLDGEFEARVLIDTGRRHEDGTAVELIDTADLHIPDSIKTIEQFVDALKKGTLTEPGPNWNNPKKPAKDAKTIKKFLDEFSGEGEAGQGAKPKPKVTPPDAGNAAGPNGWKPGSPSLDPKTAPFNYEQVIKAFGTLQEISDYKPMGGTKQKAAGRIENMVKQLEKIFPGIKDAVLKEGFSPNDATREEAMAEPDKMAKLLARYLSNKFRPYRDFAYEQKNPVKKPAKDKPAEASTQDFVEDPKVKQIELDSSREARLKIRTDYTDAEREAHSKEAIKEQEESLEQALASKKKWGEKKASDEKRTPSERIREQLDGVKKGFGIWKNDAKVRELVAKMVELEKLVIIDKKTYGRSRKYEDPKAKELETEIYHLTKGLLEKYDYNEIWGAFVASDPTSFSHSQEAAVQAANEKSGYKLGGTTVKKADYDKWLAGQKDATEPARDVEPASKPAKPPVQEAAQEPAEKKYPIEKLEDALAEKGLRILRRNNTDDFVAEGGVEDNGRQRPTLVVGDTKITLSGQGMELIKGKVMIMEMPDNDAAGNVIYTVERIVTAPEGRGKGSASKALAELTAAADKAGLTLQLEPTPFRSIIGKGESLNKQQLIDWYKKNGFEQKVEGSDAILIRKPGAKANESIIDTKHNGDVESAKDALWKMKESDRKAESPEAKALEAELIERGVLDKDGTVKRVKGKTALDTYQFEGETWRIDGIGKGREPDITIRNLETGETKVVKKESLNGRDRAPWEEVMFDQNAAGFGAGLPSKQYPEALKYLEGIVKKNEAIINGSPSKVEAKRAKERIKYAKEEIEYYKSSLNLETDNHAWLSIAPTGALDAPNGTDSQFKVTYKHPSGFTIKYEPGKGYSAYDKNGVPVGDPFGKALGDPRVKYFKSIREAIDLIKGEVGSLFGGEHESDRVKSLRENYREHQKMRSQANAELEAAQEKYKGFEDRMDKASKKIDKDFVAENERDIDPNADMSNFYPDSVLAELNGLEQKVFQAGDRLARAEREYRDVKSQEANERKSQFKDNSLWEAEVEGAEGTTLDMRRDPNNDANDAFDMEERKARELDRRVKQNAENREAGKEEEGGRRGFIGIMDRAVSEARLRGEITDKEVEGLSRIINYVGSHFFDGVKMSIRQGRPGHQGQYDVANRIVTIFKEAIQSGRFEDTAGHEVGHHLEQFLPEGDRAALRAEWLAARKKFTDKWSVFGRLVEGSDNWAKVKISKEAYAEAASDFPTLDRFVSPVRNKKGEITHYEVRPTDEMYRLFSPREWFAETFKEACREKLNNDPAYTGEQPGWKQKIAGVWNSIKTAFAQVFGKEQAKRILANFAKGRYKPEDADPSVYSEPKMSSKKDVEAETRLTPEERDAIDQAREDDRTMARGEKPELSAGGKVWRSVVDHPVVSWFKPLSMRMRTIADLNPQSEALQKVVNDFSLIPGRETEAPDYNTDSANMRNVFFNKLTKAFGPVLEDMRKMGPAELKEFNSLFIKVVEGRAPRQVGGRVGEAMKEVGIVLAEMHKYGIDAGLKLGKVEGFFPRSVDANAVDADKAGFVRAATKAYEVQFERLKQEAKDEAAKNGTEYVEAETPDFDLMARNWRDAILLGREGLDFEHGIFEEPRQGTKESFQKKREFTKDEALLFDAYRDKDVERTVINYVGGLVRKAEVSRRIGVDNGAWGKIKSEMDKQGVDPKDIAEIEQLIKSNLGIGGKRMGEETQKALDLTKLISNAAYLKLTGLLNITEAASIGLRTESASDSAKAVWQMFARTGNIVGRLTPEQTTNARNEIERIYGKGHDLASALAIEFGINTIDRGFGTIASGYHLDGGSDYQGKLNKASDGVYRMYGIHATEAAKREISLRIGADFIDTNIKWLEGTHNLQKIARAIGKEAKADNLARDRLKELGLTDANMDEFTAWVKEMRKGNETEQLQAIMGGDPMAAKYRQALIIFNKQSSVQASRSSRTESANDTPLGRMFFQFSTFTNEWSAQHGRRMQEQSRKIVGSGKYNATERMLAAGVGPAFAVATAATWGIRTIINQLTGFEFKDGKVPAWVQSLSDAFVYTGMLGPAEILWKAISRGQLPAGVVGDWLKKSWTAGAQMIDNPDSNAAQRAVASIGYRSALVPAANAGLALATEMAPMPVKVAAGVAAQVIANNRTEKGVADLFAGEKEERGSSQVPEPRTPPKPRPPSR